MYLQLTTDESVARDHDPEAINVAHGAIEVIDELASEIRTEENARTVRVDTMPGRAPISSGAFDPHPLTGNAASERRDRGSVMSADHARALCGLSGRSEIEISRGEVRAFQLKKAGRNLRLKFR